MVQPSAAMSGIGQSLTGMLREHMFLVFSEMVKRFNNSVVLGTVGGIPERIANNLKGFFDPRDLEQRKTDAFYMHFILMSQIMVKAQIYLIMMMVKKNY